MQVAGRRLEDKTMPLLTRSCRALVGALSCLLTGLGANAASVLSLSPHTPRGLKNSSVQFTATLNGKPAKAPLQWGSSNPAIAIVDANGKAMLLSPGTTTITVQV